MPLTLIPIGQVRSSRTETVDDDWDRESTRIELDAAHFTAEALMGLDAFSHVEVIFYMDKVDRIETGARHPRGNTAWPKVGIFAQRAKNRPNQIGTTICAIEKVSGTTLFLKGLDAVDGTPVLDIKPWVSEFAPRGSHRQPKWITELMREYWTK